MIRAIEIKLIDLLSSVFVMAETDGDLRVSVPVLDHDSVEEYELKKLLILPYHYCFFFDNIFHDLCFRRLSLDPSHISCGPFPPYVSARFSGGICRGRDAEEQLYSDMMNASCCTIP